MGYCCLCGVIFDSLCARTVACIIALIRFHYVYRVYDYHISFRWLYLTTLKRDFSVQLVSMI